MPGRKEVRISIRLLPILPSAGEVEAMGKDIVPGLCRAVRPLANTPIRPSARSTQRLYSKLAALEGTSQRARENPEQRVESGALVSNAQRPKSQSAFPLPLSRGIPSRFSLPHSAAKFTPVPLKK